MKRIKQFLAHFGLCSTILVVLVVSLSGCTLLDQIQLPWEQPTAEPQPTLPPVSQTTQSTRSTGEATETPEPKPTELTIWLPAEMNPKGNDQAAILLQSRLEAFAQAQGVKVTVRLKEMNGAGGMLDALTAASAAAPAALPDLLVLSRKDLETAALKSLVYPLDQLTSIVDGPDWYPFAREMSLIQGVVYGIPLIGDPLAFVYDSNQAVRPLPDWAGISTNGATFVFPADDTQAIFPLTFYLAMGGTVMDSQRRPILEEEPLAEMLALLQEANRLGRFSPDILQLQSSAQAWEKFSSGGATSAALPLSLILEGIKQTEMKIAPEIADVSLTTSSGWVWAVAAQSNERQKLAVMLAENLVEPGFLASWSEAFGRLPARSSALTSWQNESLRNSLDKLAAAAQLMPTSEVLNSVAPVLHDAVIAVLRDNVDPKAAAQKAVESLQ